MKERKSRRLVPIEHATDEQLWNGDYFIPEYDERFIPTRVEGVKFPEPTKEDNG